LIKEIAKDDNQWIFELSLEPQTQLKDAKSKTFIDRCSSKQKIQSSSRLFM